MSFLDDILFLAASLFLKGFTVVTYRRLWIFYIVNTPAISDIIVAKPGLALLDRIPYASVAVFLIHNSDFTDYDG